MATHTLKLTDFLNNYKKAENKDQEALVILGAFRQSHEDLQSQIKDSKKETIKEISIKDLATKKDVEIAVQKAKIGTIGWILTGLWLPIILFALGTTLIKHLGIS